MPYSSIHQLLKSWSVGWDYTHHSSFNFESKPETPDAVLRRVYLSLEKRKTNGDAMALKVQERLRIIVAGGDDTAGWLLGVVCDPSLSCPPPIATVPLETGNSLPFAFGWTNSLSVSWSRGCITGSDSIYGWADTCIMWKRFKCQTREYP